MRRGIAACVAALSLAGCGYRVGAKAELMPRSVRSIAIPAFTNVTPRYRLTQMLPGAIGREFITRTRYRVVADPNEADAILEGSVTNYMSAPTIFDQATGRAAGLQIIVFLNIKLVEKGSGKVLYAREGLEVRERYEVSIDQRAYFDESDAALERLSREVARQVVSTILEAF
jgi:hypothetical protein